MRASKKEKHHHSSRTFGGRIIRRLKRLFTRPFRKRSSPKVYRPYLGPHATPEEIEEGKYENTRLPKSPFSLSRLKTDKKRRKERGSWLQRLKPDRDRRIRKKLKRRARKQMIRENRKQRRIEFIRKFFPYYKRSSLQSDSPFASMADDKDRQQFRSFIYTINSTVLYMIAYLLVYMIYQITVMIVASRWKLDSVLFYYDLAFNDLSPLWSRMNIIITTFSGPAISLIIGVLFLRLFSDYKKLRKSAKLFFLWIGLHGYNLFLGAFASGVSFDEGFGYVPAWLYINIFWKILISLVFLFFLGLISYYVAPKFLDTSYSANRVKPNHKGRFLLHQVVYPWFIGSLVIFLIKIPNNMPYDTGNLVTMVFAVVPMLFNRYAKPTMNFTIEKRPNMVRYWKIIIMVLLFLLYRIGLNNGLHIELQYEFIFDLEITPI